jgi:hypothetical protein
MLEVSRASAADCVTAPLPAIKGLFDGWIVVSSVSSLAGMRIVWLGGAYYRDFGVGRSRGMTPSRRRHRRSGLIEGVQADGAPVALRLRRRRNRAAHPRRAVGGASALTCPSRGSTRRSTTRPLPAFRRPGRES